MNSYHSISTGEKQDLRKAVGLADDQPVIGCFSRIATWKGQHILLQAAKELAAPVQILVAGAPLFGENAYLDELRHLASKLQSDIRVIFLGFRDDVAKLMQICDVAVNSSIEPEPFGRIIVEAQLVGCPVIASSAGGAEEIIQHNETGWLVSPGNAGELAQAIRNCLEHPDAAKKVAIRAQEQARSRFDVSVMHKAIENLVHAVLHDRNQV